ncbi:MGMT family protein [Aquibacillus albus]|uniref:Methylated-DNA-protein-cysteine methyltransferase-like protein n=1 Tax=Aquibacillus albus TaxID=1168171 RepID=A0ABS2N0A3_9BACI|nr:MGMT family protein [Aquibacillus albus]MBM7571581.1 methylated-DNA-protein-cysteine methyltransferase-like protein [Aquibacillus albus]
MTPFTEAVLQIILDIPKGKVMTYGQIAHMAGNPNGARQVSRILHAMSKKYNLPWHRVINKKGEISLSGEGLETQKQLLERGGVKFLNSKKVDLQNIYHS